MDFGSIPAVRWIGGGSERRLADLRMTEDARAYEITVALTDVEQLRIDVQLHGVSFPSWQVARQLFYAFTLTEVDRENIQARYEGNVLRVRGRRALGKRHRKCLLLAANHIG